MVHCLESLEGIYPSCQYHEGLFFKTSAATCSSFFRARFAKRWSEFAIVGWELFPVPREAAIHTCFFFVIAIKPSAEFLYFSHVADPNLVVPSDKSHHWPHAGLVFNLYKWKFQNHLALGLEGTKTCWVSSEGAGWWEHRLHSSCTFIIPSPEIESTT